MIRKNFYTDEEDDAEVNERQKVIAELEEWVDKQPKAIYRLNDNESEEHIHVKNLKQKLNDMKEV